MDQKKNSHLKKKSKKKYLSLIDKNLYIPSYSRLNRTRSYLKIQDGCDYKCSYCTKARGFSISDNIKNLIFYAKNIMKQGIKEIVLTGVNIGGKQNFLELIQAIELSYL